MASKSNKTILSHQIVPKQGILSEEKAQELLKKFGISRQQLPSILQVDPIVEEIGAKPGEIIQIIRKSMISGKSVYYRVVL